jgi:drug/metabolite transporter (DMT)-like permease
VGGLRWNQWVALAMIVIGAVVLVLRRGPGPEPVAPVALDADADEPSDYVPQDE